MSSGVQRHQLGFCGSPKPQHTVRANIAEQGMATPIGENEKKNRAKEDNFFVEISLTIEQRDRHNLLIPGGNTDDNDLEDVKWYHRFPHQYGGGSTQSSLLFFESERPPRM